MIPSGDWRGKEKPVTFFELDFGTSNFATTGLFLAFLLIASLLVTLISKGISYR
jgi:hypothetical protein